MGRRLLQLVARALAVGAALWGMNELVVQPWRANRELVRIDKLSLRAYRASTSLQAEIARTNLQRLEAIEPASRRNVDFYIQRALNQNLALQFEAGIGTYDEALQIEQRPELYYSRGLTKLVLGRTDEAVLDLAQAARFKSNYLKYIGQPKLQKRVEDELNRAR